MLWIEPFVVLQETGSCPKWNASQASCPRERMVVQRILRHRQTGVGSGLEEEEPIGFLWGFLRG